MTATRFQIRDPDFGLALYDAADFTAAQALALYFSERGKPVPKIETGPDGVAVATGADGVVYRAVPLTS